LTAIYLDTALVVASLVHEPGTAVAHRFLQAAAERPWLISSWVETELASALAMQCRRGAIQASERDEAWMRFQELRRARLQLLELEAMDFDAAARLCLAEAPPLRAGDALHLAVCQRHRSQLVSFDQALCAAASHHRVAVELLQITTD
jgi:predicted nucleic acid-binding protein